MQNQRTARAMLILSMAIFGTIGILRREISLSSAAIALVRGGVGAVFLYAWRVARGRKASAIHPTRGGMALSAVSGVLIGINWILLFEAYRFTSVPTATLCYYMAPLMVMALSPVLFKERLTATRLICLCTAVVGCVLISGVGSDALTSSDGQGILLALGAAVLYASVVCINKKIEGITALDRTVIQLAMAAVAALPYVLITSAGTAFVPPSVKDVVLLAVAGVVHTGIAYALYFFSLSVLPAQTAALYSYIDPITALVLSALVFPDERLSFAAGVGAVLLLGAAVIGDLSGSGNTGKTK